MRLLFITNHSDIPHECLVSRCEPFCKIVSEKTPATRRKFGCAVRQRTGVEALRQVADAPAVILTAVRRSTFPNSNPVIWGAKPASGARDRPLTGEMAVVRTTFRRFSVATYGLSESEYGRLSRARSSQFDVRVRRDRVCGRQRIFLPTLVCPIPAGCIRYLGTKNGRRSLRMR